jgi:hypothetical protein
MSDPWDFSNPPGDPVADIKRAWKEASDIPKPTCDRFKVSSMELLQEHVEWGPTNARSLAASPVALPFVAGMPIVVDDTVEAGWIEAWLGNGRYDEWDRGCDHVDAEPVSITIEAEWKTDLGAYGLGRHGLLVKPSSHVVPPPGNSH